MESLRRDGQRPATPRTDRRGVVGHSLGGLYANLFARLYPQETAAVLFVEATHPRDQAVLRQHETQLTRALGKVFALPQWLFRANLHADIEWVGETLREIAAAGALIAARSGRFPQLTEPQLLLDALSGLIKRRSVPGA